MFISVVAETRFQKGNESTTLLFKVLFPEVVTSGHPGGKT